jgi:hypothetical protein
MEEKSKEEVEIMISVGLDNEWVVVEIPEEQKVDEDLLSAIKKATRTIKPDERFSPGIYIVSLSHNPVDSTDVSLIMKKMLIIQISSWMMIDHETGKMTGWEKE